jgi:hypothetical protein
MALMNWPDRACIMHVWLAGWLTRLCPPACPFHPPHPAVPSALRELLLAGSPMVSIGAQPTPGTAARPGAPASTPATGARPPAGASEEVVLDPATLAAKLAEMAELHDVTLEVPAVSASSARQASASTAGSAPRCSVAAVCPSKRSVHYVSKHCTMLCLHFPPTACRTFPTPLPPAGRA